MNDSGTQQEQELTAGSGPAGDTEVADPAVALADRQEKVDALMAEAEAKRLAEVADANAKAERERRMLAATKPQTVVVKGETLTFPAITMGHLIDMMPLLKRAMDGPDEFLPMLGSVQYTLGFAPAIGLLLGKSDGWERSLDPLEYKALFDAFTTAVPAEVWNHFLDQSAQRFLAMLSARPEPLPA